MWRCRTRPVTTSPARPRRPWLSAGRHGHRAGRRGTPTRRTRLCDVLDALWNRGTDRVRPVLSGAGHERTDRPCPAGRSVGGREPEVIAPDGAMLITPAERSSRDSRPRPVEAGGVVNPSPRPGCRAADNRETEGERAMSRQNRSGDGASAHPVGTEGGPPVRRAVVLPPAGDDVEQAVLRPAPRRRTAVTAEGTARTGETGRGETETLSTATAGSGTASAANEPEAREEAAEPDTDRGERPETAADTPTPGGTASPCGAATPARTASPASTTTPGGTTSSGGTAAPLSGLAVALDGVRRSDGAGRGSGDGDGAPGRPKAPMLAAAGIAGVLLLAVPLLIMAGNDRDERSERHATAAADSRELLDGQEGQQPPGVYAAEPSEDDAPADSSKDKEGDDGKGGQKEGKDDGKASPDESGSVTEASPPAAAQEKEEDTAKEPAQGAGRKADTTVTVAAARIVSADTGKCLTASSRGAGAELVIQPCGAPEGAQIWSFHDTDSTLRIGEDLCMGLDGGSVEKGTAIRLQRCDGSSGQKFKINGAEDLVSLKAGNKCVDVWWGEEADGTPVKLWPCTGTANQTWRRG